MLFPVLGSSSLPVVVAQPDERHANKTTLYWSGMTDKGMTDRQTSVSNEEAIKILHSKLNILPLNLAT